MSEETDERHRTAAVAYVGLGLGVIALTALVPGLAGPNRRAEIPHLLAAVPFVLLFGAFVGWGNRFTAGLLVRIGFARAGAERWGGRARRIVTMLLAVSAALRTVVFLGGATGVRPRLIDGAFAIEARAAVPWMIPCAIAMALVTVALARASLEIRWPRLQR